MPSVSPSIASPTPLRRGELVLEGAQGPVVRTRSGRELVNLASNDYLGLADHPEVVEAATRALRDHGFGMASVRFLSGTHRVHVELEDAVAELLGVEAAVLFPSCFDANAGLFEALCAPEDTICSDALNHASIIDGVRLAKAHRVRVAHRDVDGLARALRERTPGGTAYVVTDGVFSMDGSRAPLVQQLTVVREHDAMLVLDESHSIGCLGASGAGLTEETGLLGQVPLVTGTFGKALGGASGGFVAGAAEQIEQVRARARPYKFSNAVPPHVAAGSLAALRILRREPDRVQRLHRNAAELRSGLTAAGFDVMGDAHPIVPVRAGSEERARTWADGLREAGVHAVPISHPVVPRGTERIRFQVSAGHTPDQLRHVVAALAGIDGCRR